MRKFGLIGYPLGHSFSKKFFNEKFERESINDCIYENYPLAKIEDLQILINSEKDLEGLNVTIPYKSQVIRYLDKISDDASEIGAVNVLKIKRPGNNPNISGFNSDINGIRDSLLLLLRPDISKSLVLGTGGSSKAVCYLLNKLSVEYTLISRSAKPGCLTYQDLDREMIQSHRLIINTTPLGMYPDTEGRPEINYDFIGKDHILFDLVYNPMLTTFLRLGKERGAVVLNGLKMLYRQAERSWEIWNDPGL
jgi:shikimate dehydrogenase